MQDITGLNMEVWDDDYERQDANDAALEASELSEAYARIYLAATALENAFNCKLPDLRNDIRFTELVAMRKVKYER